MRYPLSLLLGIALLTPSIGSGFAEELPSGAPAEVRLKTQRQHWSYAIGMEIGQQLRSDGIVADFDLLLMGLRDAMSGQKPRLTEEQINVAMQALQKEMQAKQKGRQLTEGTESKRQGQAFLVANAKNPGVKSLPSGLQYEVLQVGEGPSPTLEDTVRTHYHGTLVNGTVFDSSIKRGEPAVFPVNGVIAGWTEALQLMCVGDKWKLFIPPELAYKERGAGGVIGPHATLVFEIELLGIEN